MGTVLMNHYVMFLCVEIIYLKIFSFNCDCKTGVVLAM